jgi:hypothetical protein
MPLQSHSLLPHNLRYAIECNIHQIYRPMPNDFPLALGGILFVQYIALGSRCGCTQWIIWVSTTSSVMGRLFMRCRVVCSALIDLVGY